MLAGQLLYFQRVVICGCQRLLEDHVDLARGAGFYDFQVAIVFGKRPDDVRLGFVQHLFVVAEEWRGGRASFFGFGDKVGIGLGDAYQLDVLAIQHGLEVAPHVAVHHRYDGDFVVLGLEGEGH